jgi:4-cresol dehydrogenase (hydroxylating) flavoprotein subunit
VTLKPPGDLAVAGRLSEDGSMKHLDAALKAWRKALGAEHVVEEPGALAAARKATFATAQRVPVLLRPGSREEVAACLRIAQTHRVPVYPVSGGRNYGYGSRVPPRNGSALIELRRMNRVIELNEELAYLTVEPGVTFQQAYEHLTACGSRCVLTTIGGSPEGSLIGNALERGDGSGPNGDIFAHVCGLEVVLPSGKFLHTGLGRFPDAKAANAFKWGLGPVLDGLFSQSNLGVVTRMTFWLARRDTFYRRFAARIDDPQALGAVTAQLRELMMEGTLRASYFLWNDFKAMSRLVQYPWEAAGGRTPLPPELRASFRQEWSVGPWNLSGSVHAPNEELGLAAQRRIERVLGRLVQDLAFASEEEIGQGPLQGVPSTAQNLQMAYWRKRSPMPEAPDPDRDGCGFIWVSCAVPATARDVEAATSLAEAVMDRSGFEPNLALLGTTARALYLVAAVIYDREVQGEDERAMACHDALARELCSAGYYPARLGVQMPVPTVRPEDDSDRVLKLIKSALDPLGVLAPGRYLR